MTIQNSCNDLSFIRDEQTRGSVNFILLFKCILAFVYCLISVLVEL